MKKYKKHEGEMKKLAESNNRLSREVEHLTQMLAAAEDCKRWAYEQLMKSNNQLRMAEKRADRYEFSNRQLEKEIEQLKGGSIYTVSKRETELKRQLESELRRSDDLSERLDTVSKRYEEAQNAVTELMDENTMLKAKLEHFNTVARRAQFECARANELEGKFEKAEEKIEQLKHRARVPISREQAEEIFFEKRTEGR